MLRNYLIVAWRNLVRHQVYSLINVLGLAVGLAFCILTLLYVRFEWSYDTFHEKAEQTYLIYQTAKEEKAQGGKIWAGTPWPLKPALQEDVPEIERIVKIDNPDKTTIRCGDQFFQEKSGLDVDPEFFEVFSFPRVSGHLQTALGNPNSVVISRELAEVCFGGEDPIGQVLAIQMGDGFQDFSVSGVVEIPENSSLRFDFLLPMHPPFYNATQWGALNYYTFVQLAPGVREADVQSKLAPVAERYSNGLYGKSGEIELHLLPLTGLHLNTELNLEHLPTSNPFYSWVLGGMAVVVLLIACVNFANLSTGLASTRLREVGMRKVLGATRGQLLGQFWGEALLLSLFALILAVALAELFLPVFNGLVERRLNLEYSASWPLLCGLVLVSGLVAGSYPALVLSGFHPVVVLKGKMRLGGTNLFSRGLVVLQFALSILLMVAVLVMAAQINYLRARSLGFNPEQVVVIDTYGLKKQEQRQLLETYRQTMGQHAAVLKVSMADRSFDRGRGATGATYEGRDIGFNTFIIDYDYLETLGLDLLEGREFSRAFPADIKESMLINESLMRVLGWRSAVGRRFAVENSLVYGGPEHKYEGKTIIGVVKDFHYEPLRQRIFGAVFTLHRGNGYLRYILVRISPQNIPATLRLLRETWDQAIPAMPFAYSFLDEDIERQYREDERWERIVRCATLFAVSLVCAGTHGLVSLAVARRTKEIGIRKVLGASVPSIVALLSKEFTYLVLAANLIAWPLAWYAMNRWLQSFAYRIELGVGVFVLGGMLALLIAWLTVSWQAIRAARANPVEALRYE